MKKSGKLQLAILESKETIEKLPFLVDLFKVIDKSTVEDIICEGDSCIIFFVPNDRGIKAWLEFCLFKGKQYLDFELVEAQDGEKKYLDYRVFVSEENKNSVMNKVELELRKCYKTPTKVKLAAKSIVASPTIF